MKNKYFLIIISLLISLFIYLFYRTGKTVVNEISIRIISIDAYTFIKTYVVGILPLNNIIIYSLPEGLWVFCITLTSRPYYIKLHKWQMNCVFIPLIFSIGLEILQLFHITAGRFDFMDIAFSFIFWLIGGFIMTNRTIKQNIFTQWNIKSTVCIASYCIVYLAHVLQ